MSKLGTHTGAQPTGLGDFLGMTHDAGSPVPLLFALDIGLMSDIVALSPSTKLIFRTQQFGRDNGAMYQGDPIAAGRARFDQCWPVLQLNPADWYALDNEPGRSDAEALAWLCAYNLGEMQRADEVGVKLCIGEWSTGMPPLDAASIDIYTPMLRYAMAHGHILGLHEYSLSGPMIGSPLCLRYRELYAALPVDARPMFAITEAGPDAGYGAGYTGQAYVDVVAAYDAEVMIDPYVLGVALFRLGKGESNMAPVMPLLTQHVIDHPTPEIEPTPYDDESYSGEFCGYDGVLVDSSYSIWELIGRHNPDAGYPITKDGVQHGGGQAEALLYYDHAVYCTNAEGRWFKATEKSWEKVAGDPREAGPIILPPPPDIVEPFWCACPVGGIEAPRITNKFNAPADYANGKHEGLDFDAYQNALGKNAPILAAQDGVIEYVNTRTGTSYGLHVVIRHPWDGDLDRYRTLYAHLSSVSVSVRVGQVVKRGDQIGVAGATGSSAIHLHFGVYDAVAGLRGYFRCADCSALWPDGVLDPEPLIRYSTPPPAPSTAWRGLHMRADGHSDGADFAALHVAKINAAKIMTNTGFDELTRLQVEGIAPDRIVLRLFAAGDNPSLKSAARFFDEQRGWLAEFNAKGGRYVEIHNEPNLTQEGLGFAWPNAMGFASWYNDVVFLIRGAFPKLLCGWPGLSPQPNAPEWIDAMLAALGVGRIDWIGAHSYWSSNAQMNDNDNGRWYRRLLGYGKQVIVTEFSNNLDIDSDADKGNQYWRYYKSLETGILGAFGFVSSASSAEFNLRRETWARAGVVTDIAVEVGKV